MTTVPASELDSSSGRVQPPAYDVAIVGLGPSGAMLANLLGAAGLRVLVLERLVHAVPTPRAIHFDGEVMRAFQAIGLDAEVAALSRAGTEGMHFVNAGGRTLLVRRGSAQVGPHGFANNHYFHQPELEAVLRSGLGRFPSVDVRLGFDLTSLATRSKSQRAGDGHDDGNDSHDGDGATLTGSDLSTGATASFRARYVVGADGARSLVRKTLGSTQEDLGLHQPWLVFDVMLNDDDDLGLPRHTVQHCDPIRPMTYCHVTGRRRRWEIMLMPGDDPAELVQPDTLWKLVSRWVRPDQATLERAAIYTFHSVIAQGWRSGPLLLAGDAAHQTPPFLGQGMCAGIRDAVNLAWKLKAVVQDGADDSLLDTYEAERAPHVRAFIDLAVRLGDVIQTTDPQAAQARDARFAEGAPALFDSPTPRLGASPLNQSEAPAGLTLPQFRLEDGEGTDALLGDGYTLIVASALWESDSADQAVTTMPAVAATQWHDAGVRVIVNPPPALLAWLVGQRAAAVLVRPDRYIAALAATSNDIPSLLNQLPS